MNSILDRFRSSNFLMITLFLQFVFLVSILLDIQIVRQVVGFVFTTFFPGFIIVRLLKLKFPERSETVLFSVGFSIAFLMLAGLLINESGFLFGSYGSLSLIPLLVVLNSFVLVGGILTCLRDSTAELGRTETHRFSPTAVLFMSLPILSILGAMWVNAFANNFILLFLLVAISMLFVIVVISKNSLPPTLNSSAVIMTAIALLFHAALISQYLVSFGSDNPMELFVFRITKNNAHWSAMGYTNLGFGRFFDMLSITILPTFYSNVLNIDPTWVLKALIPLVFSLVPLGLYQMWKRYVGEKYAFVSAFLFMAEITFYYEMLGLNRQMIAELFFVLLLLVILDKNMKPAARVLCFMVFGLALVTSHYGLSEVFLFFISLTLVFFIATKRPRRNLTVSMVLLFFTLMFAWYIYTSRSATFEDIVNFGNYVSGQLSEFTNVASRGQTVMRGLGLESAPTIGHTMSRAFAYAIQAFIVVGFFGLITRRVKSHINREFFAFVSIAVVLLGALVLIPGLANTLNMTRFFHILLFFLSPLCILGAETLVTLVSKRRTELVVSILMLIVLVPYFLFQTSFIYEVVEPSSSPYTSSVSLSLSKQRWSAVDLRVAFGYFDESEVTGATWLSRNVDVENSVTYADFASVYCVLLGYGLIYNGQVMTNVTDLPRNSYIYLNRANLEEDVMTVLPRRYSWNTTSIPYIVGFTNQVYSDGGCEILRKV